MQVVFKKKEASCIINKKQKTSIEVSGYKVDPQKRLTVTNCFVKVANANLHHNIQLVFLYFTEKWKALVDLTDPIRHGTNI